MRSLSCETVLHKLLQHESFPRAAVLHKLPQHGSFPQCAVLQEQAAPAWVPHWVTSPASKTCSGMESSLHGSAGPGRGPLQRRAPHGVTVSFRHPPAPVWGLPWATGGYLLHCGPPWTAGEQPASPLVFITSCKGRLSAPIFQAPPPPPPSSLTLVSAELFLSHHLTPLSNCCLNPEFFFFPFSNMLSQRRYHRQ